MDRSSSLCLADLVRIGMPALLDQCGSKLTNHQRRALRAIAYRHPKLVYPAFFAAMADTLKSFAMNHPQLNAELGFCAVLHTHSRRLDYHPHLHVVIPAGGIDARERSNRLWRQLDGQYLFNGFALAKVFRAKCLDAFRRARITLPESLPKKWVVQCQHVGKGLQRVRNYGFLRGNAKRLLRLVQLALRVVSPVGDPRHPEPFVCSTCRVPMRVGLFIPAPIRSG